MQRLLVPEQLAFPVWPDSPAAAAESPPDEHERRRIGADLESTLFVEAGAGSGKTTALVDRIVSLVHAGVELAHIAAITFTEKAAAELRQRVRDRLEAELARDPDERLQIALHQLDSAAISTLHAFAQRILFEHPIEAQLPPGVEVLDEIGSQMHFDERWEEFLPALLSDQSMAEALLVGDVLGIRIDHLRTLAQQIEDNWDLAAERIDPDPGPIAVDVAEAVEAMSVLHRSSGEAIVDEDKLAVRLREVGEYGTALATTVGRTDGDPLDRTIDLAELLVSPTPKFGSDGRAYKSLGNKTKWPDVERFGELKDMLFAAGELRDRALSDIRVSVIHTLAAAISAFVQAGVEERRREGRLRFHDLLVLTRQVLRDDRAGPVVRASLAHRYQRLLIDEFQDTDPIQVDIAALIASDKHDDPPTWAETPVKAGRLFFVGDPKQSIYRFRRADIGTYLQAQSVFGGASGNVRLSANFRSTRPIIDWVNITFGRLIVEVEGSQPGYSPLEATREHPSAGPGVAILGADAHPGRPKAHELRRAEANDVVDAIRTAVEDGWNVREPNRDQESWRPARLGDIAVLLPARTSLAALEQALDNADIAYRAETASLVYATAEVRDLLMVARAIDDPTDELAVVSALRTPAFGCGDDDLYLHKQQPGAAGTTRQSLPSWRGRQWLMGSVGWQWSMPTGRGLHPPSCLIGSSENASCLSWASVRAATGKSGADFASSWTKRGLGPMPPAETCGRTWAGFGCRLRTQHE